MPSLLVEASVAPSEATFQAMVNLILPQPPIVAIRREGDLIVISFPTQSGRIYQLQTRPDLTEGQWRDEGIPQNGNGKPVSFRVLVVGSNLELRVEVR